MIDGLVLTITGLLAVFLFLSLLIVATSLLAKIAPFFFTQPTNTSEQSDELAAAVAAVHQYRSENDK